MVKGSGAFAIKLDYSYMKIFEAPVEKISHTAAYLAAEAAYERLKIKEELDAEEKEELQRLKDEMKGEVAIKEKLQTEAAIVAIRSGMAVSHYTLFSTDFFRNGSVRIN
jgi:hypothetical protein